MANCSSCKAEILPGTRWCSLCRTNVANPDLGRLASPFKRLGAYFIDVVIPVFALFFIIGSSFGIGGVTKSGVAGVLFACVLILAYCVWAIVLFCKGTTPGKKILGMRVVKENGDDAGFGTMLIREVIGKWISALILSLGFLWILFDQDNQGWHDKLMSTYVVDSVS